MRSWFFFHYYTLGAYSESRLFNQWYCRLTLISHLMPTCTHCIFAATGVWHISASTTMEIWLYIPAFIAQCMPECHSAIYLTIMYIESSMLEFVYIFSKSSFKCITFCLLWMLSWWFSSLGNILFSYFQEWPLLDNWMHFIFCCMLVQRRWVVVSGHSVLHSLFDINASFIDHIQFRFSL